MPSLPDHFLFLFRTATRQKISVKDGESKNTSNDNKKRRSTKKQRPPELPKRQGDSISHADYIIVIVTINIIIMTETTDECSSWSTMDGMNNSSQPSITVRSINSNGSSCRTPRLIQRHSILALLHDFYDDLNSNAKSKSKECWKAFYEKYHAPTYMMVRPSGNPLPSSGFIDLFCCADVHLLDFVLVSIDSIQILAAGLVAVVMYTVDQKFTYKGDLNEDRCLLTCVLEEINGDIRISHEHRSTGEPLPKRSRWDSGNR